MSIRKMPKKVLQSFTHLFYLQSVGFSTRNYMDCKSFKWGFLAQGYSFVCVLYVSQSLW